MKTSTIPRLLVVSPIRFLAVSFVLLVSAAAWAGPVRANEQPAVSAPATWFAGEGGPIDCAGATLTATATDADASDMLTITQTGKPTSLTFTTNSPGVSPRTATITGTTSFTDAGVYNIVWTVDDGTGTANGTASATTVLTISGVNRQPAITAPATASEAEGSPITPITATATDADACNTLTITQAGKPVSLTFTAQPAGISPRTATITGTPGLTDAGTYTIVWTVNDGSGAGNATASTTTVLTIADMNRQPTITAPATASGVEGSPIATITATATDADAADVLTITQYGRPASLTFTTNSPGVSPRTATITGTPGFTDAGTYSIVWTVNDGTGGVNATASTTTVLTIADCATCPLDHAPVVTAPGSVSGAEGSPLAFGVAASDPDGDAIVSLGAAGLPAGATFVVDPGNTSGTLSWAPDFTQSGSYLVTFVATNALPGSATTAIAITNVNLARAFTTGVHKTIRLGSSKPFWCAQIEPISNSFALVDVIPSTLVLISAGTGSVSQIPVASNKTIVIGDADNNDTPDLRVCFAKEDLRALFSNISGKTTLTVILGGDVVTGGNFRANLDVQVVGSGGGALASVFPNPSNPEATLTFTTTRLGPVRIDMFDTQGRFVRRVVDASAMPAGEHEVRIDGRDASGKRLSSGVYYIRGTASEGEFHSTITVLK